MQKKVLFDSSKLRSFLLNFAHVYVELKKLSIIQPSSDMIDMIFLVCIYIANLIGKLLNLLDESNNTFFCIFFNYFMC